MTNDKDMQGHISGSFSSSQKPPPGLSPALQHPKSAEILREARDILSQIPTGRILLQVWDHYKIPVYVMSGREITFTNPDEYSVYLMVTPSYAKTPDLVALALACGIRDVEHAYVGFKRPDKDLDPIDYAAAIFSKELDITCKMCIIADELKENLGYTKALDLVFELGHDDVYKAQKANADFQTIANLWVDDSVEE
ncbi:MAG: hypothetical protein AB7E85_09080 [Pseudobdellovibrionaceae bacterium]